MAVSINHMGGFRSMTKTTNYNAVPTAASVIERIRLVEGASMKRETIGTQGGSTVRTGKSSTSPQLLEEGKEACRMTTKLSTRLTSRFNQNSVPVDGREFRLHRARSDSIRRGCQKTIRLESAAKA